MEKVLYRKYRPTSLKEVVGQSQVTESLKNALGQGKIGHAYLFVGPRGTGKTSVARIFAHEVNGFSYELEDDYLDIVEIDAASNTGVDNIRELKEKAIIAPTAGKYKVYIIDEVHMLSKSAANALLKMLEEPPAHVIFIMATTEVNKVPVTIMSRTQTFNFRLADTEGMIEYLRRIAKAEKLEIEEAALKIIARRGGGSYRDTLSLLDQIIALSGREITAEKLNQALGLPEEEVIERLIRAYIDRDGEAIREGFGRLIDMGLSPEIIASEMMKAIIERPNAEVMRLLEDLTGVTAPFAEAKLLVALMKNCLEPASGGARGARSLEGGASDGVRDVQSAKVSAPEAARGTRGSEVGRSKVLENGSEKAPEVPQKAKESHAEMAPEVAPEATGEAEKVEPSRSKVEEEKPNSEPESVEVEEGGRNATSAEFSWGGYLARVKEGDHGLYLQLKNCEYEFAGEELNIYTEKKFTAKLLKRQDNMKALAKYLPEGVAPKIHDEPKAAQGKDEELEKISATLGDVKEFDGEVPF